MTSFNLAAAVFSLRRECPKMAKKHGDEALTYLIFAVRVVSKRARLRGGGCAGPSRGTAGGSRLSA